MYILSYTIMPAFVLLLSKFFTFTHYTRYSLISCTTHPTKGWLVSFVNIALDIVSSYRLFLGTTYQSLGASFQITFSHPPPCVVLIIVLHISSKLSMHYFFQSVHFLLMFYFSFLQFFSQLFPRVLLLYLFRLQLVMVLYCF